MSSLRLVLEGEPKSIPIDAFATALSNLLGILTDIDCAISGEPKGSLEWLVSDLRMGSLAIETEAVSRLEDRNHSTEVIRESIQGLYMLEQEGLTPPYLTERGISHAKRLLKLIGNKGISGIRLMNHHQSAVLTARASAHVDQLKAVRHRTVGSVEGKLETISIHSKSYFNVYDRRTHKAVKCQFPPSMLNEVRDALGMRVIAMGLVYLNLKNEPVRIDLEELRRLRTRDELPTLESIGGSDPGFTGELDSVEYLRRMRTEKEVHPE